MIPRDLSCVARIRAIALDLDGVVYVGSSPLTGAVEAVNKIVDLGISVYFATNNSSRTRAEIAQKLTYMGIPATEKQVLTSGYAAGMLISRLCHPRSAHVLVIGSAGLRDEISRLGAQPVSDASQPCEFLVVGLDMEFTYPKISAGLDALMGGATFIACNRDGKFPVEGNRFLPGCGAMVAAIEATWGKGPDYEVGKPDTMFLEIISAETGLKSDEILVVGDNPESDIAMSIRYDSPSVLITSSLVDHPNESFSENIKPTLRLSTLSELRDLFAIR